MSPLIISLFFAIISPFIWGFMNLIDKFIISHRVKNVQSFAFIAAFINFLSGIVLALFLSWNYNLKDLFPSLISGIIMGTQFYIYYLIVEKEDSSNYVSLIYSYPLVVGLLSYFFLNEKLPLIAYFGMILIILGITLLSLKSNKLKIKIFSWMMLYMIISTAVYEFFIKMSTNNLPELNGLAITIGICGLVALPLALNKKIRKWISKEFKHIPWALFSEALTFLGILTTYYAMTGLPATIVSSIAAIQPLAVLFMEKVFHFFNIKIAVNPSIRKRLLPISLIVLGVILLYAFGL